jgi:NACalpha-BTF3-like transcription factor
MFGKKNEKEKAEKIRAMAERLGLSIEPLAAEEVLIKQKNKTIRITKPQVMVSSIMGRTVYQIAGEVSEQPQVPERKIAAIAKETKADRETILSTLERLNWDVSAALKELKKKKSK